MPAAARAPAADRLEEFLLPAGLAPAVWAAFDPVWYGRAHPQAEASGFAALRAHYLTQGQAEGLSPNRYFDEAWYRATYPDVAEAVAAGRWRSGFEHYCLEGHADRAAHMLFDDAAYAAANPTLSLTILREIGCFNRYDHFLRMGAEMGLQGHVLFDPVDYAARAGVLVGEAFAHYLDALRFGEAEPAPSALFDPQWYLAAQPQAASEVARGLYRGALHHYLTTPTPTRFDPVADFSEAFYLRSQPEAAALVAAGVFRNGYAHFLARGRAALAAPAPWVDLSFVKARHGVDDPFGHVLRWGRSGLMQTVAPQAVDQSLGGTLPLLARGRLDLTTRGAPALTAVVLVPALRAEALAALSALSAVAPGAVELILLDANGEAAGLARLARGARVVTAAPGRLAAAWNAALSEATAPVALLLDGAAVPNTAGLRDALRRMDEDGAIGAMGGPVVGEAGVLLEAGSLLTPEGRLVAYLRGVASQVSEAGFLRAVDGFRPTQILLRRAMAEALGGFAEAEDEASCMDLCLRGWQAGYRMLYDPALAVALPGQRAARTTGLPRNEAWLAGRHAHFLAVARQGAGEHAWRTPGAGRTRALVMADHLPEPGEAAAERVVALARDGADVTLYPLDGGPADPALLPAFLPETVEIICGPGAAGLDTFLARRGDGFFQQVETV